jgi:hypothetical protein
MTYGHARNPRKSRLALTLFKSKTNTIQSRESARP